jgi:hypothetical protein
VNRPSGRKLMLGHVSGEGAVRSVDFVAGTAVDDRCELCWRDHGGADASDRLRQRIWDISGDAPEARLPLP